MKKSNVYPTIPVKGKYLFSVVLVLFLFGLLMMKPKLSLWHTNEAFAQGTVPPIISAGGYHTCWLKADGTLACWGQNQRKQAEPPEGSFTQVDAGGYHTCALKADHTIVCWGATPEEQNIPTGNNFVQISSGTHNNCALQSDGSVVCWGANWYGGQTASLVCPPDSDNPAQKQLKQRLCGEGTGYVNVPFTQISVGDEFHTCGLLKTNNTAVCWEFDPNQPNRIVPKGIEGKYYQQLPFENVFTQVSAGGFHSCGLKPDGTAICWANEGRIYEKIDEVNLTKKIGNDKIDVAQIDVERGADGRVTKIKKIKNKYRDDVDQEKIKRYTIEMEKDKNNEVVKIQLTNQCGKNTLTLISSIFGLKTEEKVDNVCINRDIADKDKKIIGIKINKRYSLCGTTTNTTTTVRRPTCNKITAFDKQCAGNEKFCVKCEAPPPCDEIDSEEIIDVLQDVDNVYESCKDNKPGCETTIKVTKAPEVRQSGKTCEQENYVQKDEYGRLVTISLVCSEKKDFKQTKSYTDKVELEQDNGKIKKVKLTKQYSVQTIGTGKMEVINLEVTWIDERGRSYSSFGDKLPDLTAISPKPQKLQVAMLTFVKECPVKEQYIEERDVKSEGDVDVKITPQIDEKGNVFKECRKKCRGNCQETWAYPAGVTENDCVVGVEIATKNSWGNYFKQTSPPPFPFTQISAGGFHTCGIKPDSSVACWGSNDYGQAKTPICPTPEELARQKQSCGDTDSCPDYNNLYRQCQGAQGNVLFSQVSAGGFHTCGLLKSDGSPFCWGKNEDGQATLPTPPNP